MMQVNKSAPTCLREGGKRSEPQAALACGLCPLVCFLRVCKVLSQASLFNTTIQQIYPTRHW